MGIETYPVLEGHDESEFFLCAEWKWLTDCMEGLETIAKELNLTPLDSFYSYSRQDAIDSLSEEDVEDEEAEAEFRDGWYWKDGYKLWSPERQWFEPGDALQTTQALLHHLEAHPEAVNGQADAAEGFAYILEELQKVLAQAQTQQKRFYLKAAV